MGEQGLFLASLYMSFLVPQLFTQLRCVYVTEKSSLNKPGLLHFHASTTSCLWADNNYLIRDKRLFYRRIALNLSNRGVVATHNILTAKRRPA